jgi:hypothetical protein
MTQTTTSFTVLREETIPELNATALLYRHLKTGAEVLSIQNDDENKVFGISFRTPPTDATGVAHILEHSVLCGSRKYPLKEPFVELIKGSLNTFLNAMTFPDKTCYPVASQNVQDFYNLIDVYLDAVFYPRLTRHIFEQEGWHYELESPDAPLLYKGIVFNEMKGAYGSPDDLIHDYSQQSLFPDTTYGVDAGGDPQHILDLTYEQLLNFHRTLYHPSNAFIYFYGDDDPERRLDIIDAYLNEFEPLDVDSSVALQTPFEKPRRITHTYRVDQDSPDKKKSQVTVNWLLPVSNEPRLMLAFSILEHILIGTPASPLRKALLDSGLGEDLTGAGYVGRLRQGYFSVGMKGIATADAEKIEALIIDTLTDLFKQGLDRTTIEASLNTVEFRLRENNTGGMPRGLVAMIRALTTWLHHEDPFALLSFEKPLSSIKTRLAEGMPYFENLIHEYLLDNNHRTTIILQPDPQQGQRETAAEQARLDSARAAMSSADIQEIVENTHLLKQLQTAPDPPEALATIPRLKLEDLERHNKTIPLAVQERQGCRVLYHDLPTSGIVYLDIGLNGHVLPQDLLPYLPLFGQALLEMGTEQEDYVQLLQRIGRKTGGISVRPFSSRIQGQQESAVWLFLRSKVMHNQADDLLAVLRDILLTVRLDNRERFRQMVLEEKADMETAIMPAGHRMVNMRLRSLFNEATWVDEQMNGFSYLFFLRELVEQIENDWDSVLAKLEQIRQTLINRSAMLCNVTVEAENWQQFAPRLDDFLAALPSAPATPLQWTPAYSPGFEGLTIPSQVNYVGKGSNIYQFGCQPHGSIAVITNYLRTTWLWERVRVQGGAYGGFCVFDRYSGVFTYISYRDPNLLATLDVYDQTSQFLRQVELSQEEVAHSIIGSIGDLDAYQLPDAKGYNSMLRYLVNDSDEARQQLREEILATSVQDFRAFADVLERIKEEGNIVVLGSADAIGKANERLNGLLQPIELL